MNHNVMKMAAEILEISLEEVQEHCMPVPEICGYYIWNPMRGGQSMLVSEDGGRLVATSAVGFDEHLAAYLAGKRN